MKPILQIQNDASEGPGLLTGLMAERGIPVEAITGPGLDDTSRYAPANYAALLILGGAQGVYEQDRYPYLTQEIALIRAFVEAGRPVLGLCLGAQLMAAAMGGEVQPNAQKELGWGELELSEEGRKDPLLSGLPARFPVFHFHGDFFTPPAQYPSLASTPLTAFQAVRYQAGVYGFQCHPEVDPPLIEIMCRNNHDYMQANGSDAEQVIAQSAGYVEESLTRGRLIFGRWLDMVRESR